MQTEAAYSEIFKKINKNRNACIPYTTLYSFYICL